MSKPTPAYFCVHTGYFRNDRTLALREKIGDRAFHIMPMLWSYAGENQLDGDLSDLSDRRFQQILEGCHLKLTLPEVRKIKAAIHSVGFIQKGRLHSWEKFNRHCFDLEKRQEIKRNAAFARWQTAVETPPDRTRGNHVNGNGNGQDSPSKRLWLIESALKNAKGPAKKALLIQREELLSHSTGVDLSEPTPTVRAPQQTRNPRGPMPKAKMRSALEQLKGAVNDGNPVPE